MKKITIISVVVIAAVILSVLIYTNSRGKAIEQDFASLESFSGSVEIFKSSSCGCCGIYADYVNRNGLDVNINTVGDTSIVKSEFNIPSNMQSCHTSVYGDYYVEGHVPLEAVAKLLEEQPDIAGIAMPGMPPGSPGMPGPKRGDFVVYAVNHDGSTEEFMRV